MDQEQDEFRIKSVSGGGVGRAVPIATFLVGLFLGAAVVKPWDLMFPPQPRPSVESRPAASLAAGVDRPSSSPAPSSDAPAECAFAGGWRVFALGQSDPLGGDGSSGRVGPSAEPSVRRDIGNPLRRWLEVDPLKSAPGPGDGRIPFVTIVSDRIAGIGYCPPPNGVDGPPAGVRFRAWTLDSSGTPTLLPLRAATLATTSTIEVAVFVGEAPAVGGDAHWAPGRYVFAVESQTSDQYSRWFGVDIRTPPGHPSN